MAQDVLWDGQNLYMTSRLGYLVTSTSEPFQNRLYRYSYYPTAQTWAPDPGFPVNIPGGGTEALTIANDTIAFSPRIVESGMPFIADPTVTDINDPTSTMQNVDPRMGILIEASSVGVTVAPTAPRPRPKRQRPRHARPAPHSTTRETRNAATPSDRPPQPNH